MLFDLNTSVSDNKDIIKRATKRNKSILSDISTLKNFNKKDIRKIIEKIRYDVNKHLGKYHYICRLILDKTDLDEYIELVNKDGHVAIDTETTGLDIFDNNIVGISLYCSKANAVYIPLRHKSYNTFQLIEENMDINEVLDSLKKITAKVIMHNAKFDLKFLSTIGYYPKIAWDTFICERLLTNGTNLKAALKPAYSRNYELEEEVLSFDDYFKDVPFDLIPIKDCYIYAAMDAKFTYALYLKQKEKMEKEEYKDLRNLFFGMEMPLIRTVMNMENRGIAFNDKLVDSLKTEFEKKVELKEQELYNEIKGYNRAINNYRKVNGASCKLTDPINFSSPLQVAIILYDIIGITNETGKRQTGEEILKKINNNFTNLLLEYRELKKLLTTYIDKMPSEKKKDNRIHTSFNQMGTNTGRFSSENPNLQNIPTHYNIRNLFIADEGKYLISADYKSQEPRITSHISNDKTMIEAFTNNYDFYAFLGSKAYGYDYEQCLEGYIGEDKKGNKIIGKEVRKISKNSFLGICYGMGANTLASNLGIDIEQARESLNDVYKACPGLLRLKKEQIEFAKQNGYVETYWGRRRYLNYINKSRYGYNFLNNSAIPFDPLSFSDNTNKYKQKVINELDRKLNSAKSFKTVNWIKSEAKKEGIEIIDNSGFIAEDERYCINTVIQGTAADMMKIALLNIDKDSRLKELEFELLLTIHDEIIGQCPIENIKEAVEYIKEDMLKHTLEFSVPFGCDIAVTKEWGGTEIEI